jgi:hypothetical protein
VPTLAGELPVARKVPRIFSDNPRGTAEQWIKEGKNALK